MSVLLDTGILYATIDRNDKWHDVSVQHLSSLTKSILMPATVVTETSFLVSRLGGNKAVAHFLRDLEASTWQVVPLQSGDYGRVSQILERHADTRIDFVDATVMALAERLGIRSIFTVDRRDFAIYRPRHWVVPLSRVGKHNKPRITQIARISCFLICEIRAIRG